MRQRQSRAIAAGIDLGSNSFRLLIAEAGKDNLLRPLHKDLATVRLSENLRKSGRLSTVAIERGESALSRFAEALAAYRLDSFRACGTHALRLAANRQEFLRKAGLILGRGIEVISGEEEASLSLLGVSSALRFSRYPMLVADVGGGSTELIWRGSPTGEVGTVSLPLGAVGLTEEFGTDYAAMRNRISESLTPALLNFPPHPAEGLSGYLIACGGAATSLAVLALGLTRYDEGLVHNYTLSGKRLAQLVGSLASISGPERSALPGLTDGRGEIIMAGSLIYQELLRITNSRELVVSDAGLLEGILRSGLANHLKPL